MWKKRILALIILLLGVGLAFFVVKSEYKLNKNFGKANSFLQNHQFKVGLDLSGGSYLLYQADTSKIPANQLTDQMSALRDALEKRLNGRDISGVFGVAENSVRVEGTTRIAVELPGVTDATDAIKKIGETPLLEFKVEAPKDAPQRVVVDKDGKATIDTSPQFVDTGLTGSLLKKASLEFDQNTREPKIGLQFNDDGTKLFDEITKANVGKVVAIFLNGEVVSAPVVREEIPSGTAEISGNFTPAEAKDLVNKLNYGALPIPVSHLSTQTIGASLGANAVHSGVKAAIIGFLIIALFLILWYRLPGLVAVIALGIYVVIILSLFKLIPITLTAAGIAGFIISIGIAVDANVLIFERVKEELRSGRTISDAVATGFSRAWFSIRDSNVSSIITASILFLFGTALIKGFALTLGMGVLVSMFSAITITRIFLYTIEFVGEGKVARFLFSSGLSK